MHIAQGTKLGVLRDGPARSAAEIRMETTVEIGPLMGIPLWEGGAGAKVLFLIPLQLPGWMVSKSARRLGGAFMIAPGESFTLRGPSQEETVYCFSAVSAVEVAVERGARCGFCRSRFKDGDTGWLPLASKSPGRHKILCLSCARAWGMFCTDNKLCRFEAEASEGE